MDPNEYSKILVDAILCPACHEPGHPRVTFLSGSHWVNPFYQCDTEGCEFQDLGDNVGGAAGWTPALNS